MSEFCSLYDWCYQVMWLFSVTPENPEIDSVMEKHGADALYSAVKRLMHAIWTEDEEDKQDVLDCIIRIVKAWKITRWSESELANGKPLVRTPNVNAHLHQQNVIQSLGASMSV